MDFAGGDLGGRHLHPALEAWLSYEYALLHQSGAHSACGICGRCEAALKEEDGGKTPSYRGKCSRRELLSNGLRRAQSPIGGETLEVRLARCFAPNSLRQEGREEYNY
eukprot:scaffold272624_cov32-Tisochrysis_lutea.AAC.1